MKATLLRPVPLVSFQFAFVGACAVALSTAGCVSDHSELAAHPGEDAGPAGAGGRSARHDAAAAGMDAGGPEIVEPPAVRSITLVHGVIDSPFIAFCLAAVRGGKEAPSGAPIPLEYGHTARLAELEGIDVTTDGVLPYVVAAASADEVRGLSCPEMFALATTLGLPPSIPDSGIRAPGAALPADARAEAAPPSDATTVLDASNHPERDAIADASDSGDARDASDGPSPPVVPIPAVRFAALPVIPPGSFVEPRGYVVVAAGCIGGPGVTDPSEKSVCGEPYSPSTPTLTEMVVSPKAGAPRARVALSVLGGTPAITQVDLRIDPATHGDRLTVAQRVTPGALRPSSPYSGATAFEIGATSAEGAVLLFTSGSSVPSYQKTWQPTLEAGGIDDLADGTAYTLIVIGPSPGFAKRQWWNEPLVTIVR